MGAGSPTQVKIYENASCSGAPDATGTVAQFTGAGITVNVPGDATTALSARASDAASNDSACSNTINYVEDSTGGSAGGIPRCDGRKATLVGTPGADDLIGTKRADVIAGLGGADKIVGRGGADLACGGGGADTLSGRAGPDRLFGGEGFDALAGGKGQDLCRGGPGGDSSRGCERGGN